MDRNGLERNEENRLSEDQVNRIHAMFLAHVDSCDENQISLDEIRRVMDRPFMWYEDKGKEYYTFYLAFKRVSNPNHAYNYRIITVTQEILQRQLSLVVSGDALVFSNKVVSYLSPADRYHFMQETDEHFISQEFKHFIEKEVLLNSEYEFFFPREEEGGIGRLSKYAGKH